MKKLVILLFAVMILAGSCAEDIIVNPPGELRGVYEGLYRIIWNYGGSGLSNTEEQYIEWTFTDQRFFMNATRTDEKPAITYDLSGNYGLENVMIFSDIIHEPGTFSPESIPEGEFSLQTIRHDGAPDTLKLEQPGEDLKTIFLVKVE